MMNRQARHAILAKANRDECARQDYVFSMKQFVTGALAQAGAAYYRAGIEPALEREDDAGDRHAIRRRLERAPHYQMASSLKRTIQELIWDTTGESVERQLEDLIETAAAVRARGRRLGSLRLDPGLRVPRYLSAVDIHSMPGNYHVELTCDDVFAGAIYDRGVYLFSLGGGGPNHENNGKSLAAFVKHRFPDLEPKRILEMGCTVGSTALPFVDAFPTAKVHAIDVAAPLLRYAHARSELSGRAVQFSQQNAENTDFADSAFDLVVSTGLLHETSGKALPRIMTECFRLLRPGGVMVHGEDPQYDAMDPYDATLHDWGTRYNNEPFMSTMHEFDLVELAVDAGFARETAFPQIAVDHAPSAGSKRDGTYRGQTFAGRRYFSGAVK
jgi:ubiquinone/menaquinone biosynthesis C-methylase UbiE